MLQWFCSYPQHDFLCTAAIISVSQHLQYPINDLLGPDLSLEISQSCIVHTLQLVFMSACHGSSSATLAGNHIDNLTSPLSACPSTFHLVISATLPPWFALFGSVFVFSCPLIWFLSVWLNGGAMATMSVFFLPTAIGNFWRETCYGGTVDHNGVLYDRILAFHCVLPSAIDNTSFLVCMALFHCFCLASSYLFCHELAYSWVGCYLQHFFHFFEFPFPLPCTVCIRVVYLAMVCYSLGDIWLFSSVLVMLVVFSSSC